MKARGISNKNQKLQAYCVHISHLLFKKDVFNTEMSGEWRAHNVEEDKDISKSFLALRKLHSSREARQYSIELLISAIQWRY